MAKAKNKKDQKTRSRNRTLKIKEANRSAQKKQIEMFQKMMEEQKQRQEFPSMFPNLPPIDPMVNPNINTEGPII